MLPRWHVIYGLAFTILLGIFAPGTGFLNLSLVFLSSFLIDIDHYIVAVQRNKSWSLRQALNYYKVLMRTEKQEQSRRIYRRGPFFIFHTIEVHIFIALLGMLWEPFFYIFIGMAFHSLLDVYSLLKDGRMYRREYFLFNWLWKRI